MCDGVRQEEKSAKKQNTMYCVEFALLIFHRCVRPLFWIIPCIML